MRLLRDNVLAEVEFPTDGCWNGKVLGGYVRNSAWVQRENDRAQFQWSTWATTRRGAAMRRWFDERGVSGRRMHTRVKLQTLLGLLVQGALQGIVCADVSRLSRDERLLDPMVIAETLRDHAEGRLLTHGMELDLRREQDWALFGFLAAVASRHRDELRLATSQGYSVAVRRVVAGERPVFRQGKVMIGYRRVPILESSGEARRNANGRIVTTLVRDLAVEDALAAVAEEFDSQANLRAVVGALHRRGTVGPSHATDGYTWTSRLLREILNDRMYQGLWVAGSSSDRSCRQVPELMWWPPARMEAWRSKFLAAPRAGQAQRQHVPHPLLGLAICGPCGGRLTAFGAKSDCYTSYVMYRCPNRKRGCPTQTLVSEQRMLRAMAALLSGVLVMHHGGNTEADAERRNVSARIAAVSQRQAFVSGRWTSGTEAAPDWLQAEVRELASERAQLERERAAIEAGRRLTTEAAELLHRIRRTGAAVLLHQRPELQGAVWRLLIAEARFTVGGSSGKGRTLSVELVPLAGVAT